MGLRQACSEVALSPSSIIPASGQVLHGVTQPTAPMPRQTFGSVWHPTIRFIYALIYAFIYAFTMRELRVISAG